MKLIRHTFAIIRKFHYFPCITLLFRNSITQLALTCLIFLLPIVSFFFFQHKQNKNKRIRFLFIISYSIDWLADSQLSVRYKGFSDFLLPHVISEKKKSQKGEEWVFFFVSIFLFFFLLYLLYLYWLFLRSLIFLKNKIGKNGQENLTTNWLFMTREHVFRMFHINDLLWRHTLNYSLTYICTYIHVYMYYARLFQIGWEKKKESACVCVYVK